MQNYSISDLAKFVTTETMGNLLAQNNTFSVCVSPEQVENFISSLNEINENSGVTKRITITATIYQPESNPARWQVIMKCVWLSDIFYFGSKFGRYNAY